MKVNKLTDMFFLKKYTLLLIGLLSITLELKAQSSQIPIFIDNKEYQKAFDFLKYDYYKFKENSDSTSIYTLSKWIEYSNQLLSKLDCKSKDNKFIEETDSDASCLDRVSIKMALTYFLTEIILMRAVKKMLKSDLRGAIKDLEYLLTYPVSDKSKGWAFFLLGTCYIDLGDKEKGCDFFSKSGELGNEEAYKYIQEICN